MPDAPPRLPPNRHAPVQRFVLDIALAQLEGRLRLHQLSAEVERVRAVRGDIETRKQLEGIPSDVMAVAIVDVNPVGSDLDPEVRVADGLRHLLDLIGRSRERLPVPQAGETTVDAYGQPAELLGGLHDSSSPVSLADRRAAMRTLLHREHVFDAELGDDPEQHRVDAGR